MDKSFSKKSFWKQTFNIKIIKIFLWFPPNTEEYKVTVFPTKNLGESYMLYINLFWFQILDKYRNTNASSWKTPKDC